MRKVLILLFIPLLFFSCHRQQEQAQQNSFAPKVVEAHGYIIPKDSMPPPTVVMVDEKKLKKIPAGKPTVVPTNTNVHPAAKPKVAIAGMPDTCTPGQEGFVLPRVVPAIDSPFGAGVPEVVIARDPDSKGSFSSYGKLQGLHTWVRCSLQDKSGNLWFGTHGGATKFDGKSFTNFTEKEGLISRYIFSILEDKNGNIWFGNYEGGVTKYDGKSFTNYTEKEGMGKTNGINAIIEDKNGNLWFAIWGEGIIKYDGKSFISFTEKQGLSSNFVRCLFEDKSGNIWCGTELGGVSKYDGKSFANYTKEEGLISDHVYSIAQDKKGNLWFGTRDGASKYDGIIFSQYTEKENLVNNAVSRIYEDKSGNLWFGTMGGVSKYDGETFTNFTESEGLISNSVWNIMEDKNGNLWFDTERGVSKYEGKSFTHFTEKEGLRTSFFSTTIEDKSGNLWLGSYSDGVTKYDGKSFTQFTTKNGLVGNMVLGIVEDRKGDLWFGTTGGVSRYDGKFFTQFTEADGLSDNDVESIIEDKKGNLWFGTLTGISKYDGKSFANYTISDDLTGGEGISYIIEDKSGNLWLSNKGGGVLKYDGRSFTRFTTKDGLCDNTVVGMIEDRNGGLWFATAGGASRYDGKTFTNYTEEQGLCNNGVRSVLEDKRGNFWFGTLFGISILSREKLAENSTEHKTNVVKSEVIFKNYTYQDGFSGIGCMPHTFCEAKDGTIWIGADDRLTAYHPGGDKPDTIPPNIQLTSIGLYNENIAWKNLLAHSAQSHQYAHAIDTSFLLGNGVRVSDLKFDGVSRWYDLPEHLSLAYNNNYLTFNFVGITSNSPQKVKYKYKLEGMDENWSTLTFRSEATYGNLPNGTYTFTVRAMNGEGYWSKDFSYTFTIRPPWWKTWWFISLMALVIIGSIALYIKWRERDLRESQKVLERTVKDRTAEVVKQKERSEELLLNILPSEVAEELKDKGSAKAKLFDDVTVLFTDFVSFTNASERLSPQQLVDELNACFSAFDKIMAKYNIEKIKTVGDGYIAVSGLPLADINHAENIVKAAIEIREFMLSRRLELGENTFEIRIGVHCGSVVAGIVGVKKFAYDIWGDTVNIAARMEQNSEAGKINISQTTYELVKDKFTCIYRGEIEAKNKGKLKMYFVN